jgi:hypothetical protein
MPNQKSSGLKEMRRKIASEAYFSTLPSIIMLFRMVQIGHMVAASPIQETGLPTRNKETRSKTEKWTLGESAILLSWYEPHHTDGKLADLIQQN